MKKSIVPLIVGMFVAFTIFWVGQPAVTQYDTGSELPKKAFAKSQVEMPSNLAVSADSSQLNVDEKVKTTTTYTKTNNESPNKGDFIKIADTFMNDIVQPTTEDYKVKNFDDKAGLIEHLNQYATTDVAKYYVDGLFEEKQEGLYIIPTELPPWVLKGEPSTLTKVSDGHYQLTQNNSTDLYGDYTIQLSFKQQNDNWIIESVDVK